jgi:zinc protease
MAWEAQLEKHIAALTPEQVESALKRHIDPRKLIVVSAGDFEVKPAQATTQPSLPASFPARRD